MWFRMVDAPTIVRLELASFFCFIVLGSGLNCLMPSMSFAGVPLQESYPAVSPPVMDSVWATDTKSDKRIAYNSMSLGGRDACFLIEGDSIEDRLGRHPFSGKRALLLPLTTMCVGLFPAA